MMAGVSSDEDENTGTEVQVSNLSNLKNFSLIITFLNSMLGYK